MSEWLVDADVLARSRFRVSAFAETVAALLVLLGRPAAPGQLSDVAGLRAAFRERLARNPVEAAFARSAVVPFWVADFLCTPPGDDERDFADELGRLRRTPDEVLLADLAVCLGGREPAAVLRRPGLAGSVAGLLTWVWETAVRPDWPRRAHAFEADIVARTRDLSAGGWAAALGGLRPGMRWLGEGRLQINGYAFPPRDLRDATLLFIPTTTRGGWVGWDPPHRFSIVYPCAGLLAAQLVTAPDALARLIGPGRATILAALAAPMSTTQLVAVTGHGLGSVGNHLRVLLEARLVRRRRAGRSVLYYRTELGDELAADDPAS
ncbi:winged helix-turn-helix domain-containing protein [Amorphoplanes nipponensis]|uniref:Transcriptional regulator n=1 Tax=Actinoplanes nipponensis TaxID=135950 RepID=A0A919JKW0_9ACTN|nr:helix-turn-helix domain-containing protein [Actinoplanes nipponensis]GIE52874.1 transcriptional regulator [Actinoplanes nipponensis]